MNGKQLLKIIIAPFMPFLMITLVFIAFLSCPPFYLLMLCDDSVSLSIRYALAVPFAGWIIVIFYNVFVIGYELIGDILGD